MASRRPAPHRSAARTPAGGGSPRGAGDAESWFAWMALLGDPVRVRLLRLLAREELGVGELARVVQLPQSTVSRHLKTLLDAGWIARRNEGTASLHRVARLVEPAAELWALTQARFDQAPTATSDDRRLLAVLAERRADSKAFFGRIGGEWSTLRAELFGQRFNDEALLGLLDPDLRVADLGCGTGEAAERLAPLVARVIAVDREPSMLAAARARLSAFDNVEFRQGDLLRLPLRDGEVDAAVISLVLHHVEVPRQAIEEAARVLRPGGHLLVVDMMAHDHESWRRTMGHRHLGFDQRDVEQWAEGGAVPLSLRRLRALTPDPSGKGPGLFAALLRRGGG